MYLPLSRSRSKALAIILIAVGILLIPDIIAPTPGADLINLFVAKAISANLGYPYPSVLMATFLFGFALIGMGLLIYPYNTERLIVGRGKAAIHFLLSHPFLVAAAVVMFIILYYVVDVYYTSLEVYVNSLIG